jgi:outer membrane protein assembly factor BamE (lipoprotein component of BamABCDE complex)
MRSNALRLILVIVVAILTLVAVQLDIGDRLRARFLGEATAYANGYTEHGFRSIKVGMTMAQVNSILGPPLGRGPWGDLPQVWFYTQNKTGTDNFWRRWVVVDTTQDRVAEIIDDFWVD